MIIVGKHVNGITLNELEYLLDDDDNIMQFETEELAKTFLKDKGFTEEDIWWLVFEEMENKL